MARGHFNEAGLLAAEDQSAIELQPDLHTLLAPLTDWGALELTLCHPLGTVRLGLPGAVVRPDLDGLVLENGPQQLQFTSRGVARCHLLHACHGEPPALHWFDRDGCALVRLSLPDGAQTGATRHLMAHTLASGDIRRRPHIPHAPIPALPARWCTIERTFTAANSNPGHIAAALRHVLRHRPAMTLSAQAPGWALSYHGPVLSTAAPGSSGGTGPICQIDLYQDTLSHAQICLDPDGQSFLRLHGRETGPISLQPQMDPATARVWLNMLLPGSCR